MGAAEGEHGDSRDGRGGESSMGGGASIGGESATDDAVDAEPGGHRDEPLAGTTDAPLCDLCGSPMRETHCKLVCDRCGYTRDCSDP